MISKSKNNRKFYLACFNCAFVFCLPFLVTVGSKLRTVKEQNAWKDVKHTLPCFFSPVAWLVFCCTVGKKSRKYDSK